ncbi:MAG TPA: HEPN domain-containing protein [Lichenihabitans sp.]|jgi:HEPN domain-containing protein|nr:HEPN domain-containing protein [Lichenihabitans sp.]
MSAGKAIAADLRLAAQCLKDARILAEGKSRNAAYLASQAAEHLVRAVSTSEGLHIERAKAHQIDTNIRSFPNENVDKKAFLNISTLEIYATTYRYPTIAGRIIPTPAWDQLEEELDRIEKLLALLFKHFGVDPASDGPASSIRPRR